jgi:translation initiation factor IF-3
MKYQNNKNQQPFVISNERIKYDNLRVTMVDGQTAILSKKEALKIAESLELDLVLVTDKADPPVCKITSLNKYLYELKQREKEAKKKQRENKTEVKEIRMSLNIEDHDLEVKANNARKFLDKKATVLVTVTLKGRERGKQDMARQLLYKFAELTQTQLDNISNSGNRISAKLK